LIFVLVENQGVQESALKQINEMTIVDDTISGLNSNANANSFYYSTKFLLVGIVSLVHFASVATSFQPFSYLPNHSHSNSHSKQLWLSSSPSSSPESPENVDAAALSSGGASDEETANNNPNVGYDDLYEFLTRRTGEPPAGETERRRKRDRIKDYMVGGSYDDDDVTSDSGSSSDGDSNSSTESASNLIQPIRMEDGKVDEELIKAQQQEEGASRSKVRFDSLFSGMPSLDEIISRGPSEMDGGEGDFSSATTPKKKKTRMTDDDDFSWFEPERLRIVQEYDMILQETKERIREQRKLLQDEKAATAASSNKMESGSTTNNNGEDENDDGDAIPDNAENIADAIVTQEMNRMITSVQVERAKERLQAYEIQRSANLQSREYGGASDDVVDQIFKETAKEWERTEKLKAKAEEYQEYERMRQREAAAEQSSFLPNNSDNYVDGDGQDMDMDDWTLDRLEEMLEKSQNREDDNGSITDILEENIEDLRIQIERESQKGSIEPQTMKEWQMYRAIATRLGEQQKLQQQQKFGDGSGSMDSLDEILSEDNRGGNYMERKIDEAQVAQQLNSWREYVEKEEGMRKQSGLSSVSKLPFDYLGTKTDQIEAKAAAEEAAAAASDEASGGENDTKDMTRRELRRQVNMQAVQAMEDLIQKSDSRRTELLKKQLDIIKTELESNDYNDIEEYEIEEEAPASIEPVDLTGVFTQGRDKDDDKRERATSSLSSEEVEGVNHLLSFSGNGAQYSAPPSRYEEPPSLQQIPNQQQEPPNSPFYSDSYSDDDLPEDRAPTPNTPFFQDQSTSMREEEVVDTENKLGSVDEQKLQAMFRKANARTRAEQDTIRKDWEDFQAFEKGIRDKSGLTSAEGEGSDESSLTDDVELGYDVQDVMTGDGDFDAEKILSTIGPRPTRTKKTPPSSSNPGSSSTTSTKSELDRSEIEDAIYRSVAAAGGGRGKDDEALKEKDRADYDAYLVKEKEMKLDLDGLEDEIDQNTLEGVEILDIDINDPEYVEENLGPRPVVKPKRKEILNERELSDRGGVRAGFVEDDDDDDDDNDDAIQDSMSDGLVPGWLRKERAAAAGKSQGGGGGGGIGGAFLGSDINEVFDDDQYDQNLRQLHEYEQRRAGKRGKMGIDISDVLGRRGSDDYVDYTYDNDYFRGRQDGWGDTNFAARKSKLLDYIELDPSEVNNLMAYKDSAYATGASQYLPRINKPFKEFGAIFRLEGVLVDITGLQQKAWNRVAAEFDLKEPLLEDVQRAAVLKPDAAVKEMFFTSMDDFVLVRRIVDSYRWIFREEFDTWANEEGIVAKSEDPSKEVDSAVAAPMKGSLALGFEDETASAVQQVAPPPVLPADEGSRLRYLKEAWTKTANQFGFPIPTNEQIAESSILTPDIAVVNIFRWSEDQMQVNKIVAAYSILQAGGTVPMEEEKPDPQPAPVPENTAIKPEEITEDMILELQYMAWEKVADENSLEAPDPEEVLAAAVLNNPEIVVVDGFGWTEDPTEAAKLASRYRDCLTKFVNELMHNRSYSPASTESNPEKASEAASAINNPDNKPMMPTDEEILSSQLEAWKETARAHDFDAPPLEQIQPMSKLKPKDAVRQLILLDYDINDLDPEEKVEFELTLKEIIETYTSALEKSSKTYLAKYNLSIESQRAHPSDAGIAQKSKEVTQDEIYSASFDAWTSVAWKLGFSLPIQQEIQFALTVGPKEAIMGGFCWTESEEEADDIAQQYLNQIKTKRDGWHEQGFTTTVEIESSSSEKEDMPLVRAMPDVTDWIQSLQAVEMGCGVATHLEDDQMNTLLEFAKLSEQLPVSNRVSNSNGYLRDSQQLLGISLRIERRPDQCVVFDTSPVASVAAHEHDMRSVALVGPYPRYELLAADTSASSVNDLTALNIRRLFGERIYDQPELETQTIQPLDYGRKVKTKTQWAGDE
jgi:beta-phosphoglucomutase-like phosphatase (HAD superfamily)